MQLGLELYGPCSETGAIPDVHDTVAVLDQNGRVSFHRVLEIERQPDTNYFSVLFKNGNRYHSSQCYLLYSFEKN